MQVILKGLVCWFADPDLSNKESHFKKCKLKYVNQNPHWTLTVIAEAFIHVYFWLWLQNKKPNSLCVFLCDMVCQRSNCVAYSFFVKPDECRCESWQNLDIFVLPVLWNRRCISQRRGGHETKETWLIGESQAKQMCHQAGCLPVCLFAPYPWGASVLKAWLPMSSYWQNLGQR